jgi:protein O-GlcNAc transferase
MREPLSTGETIARIEGLIAQGQWGAAELLCRELLRIDPNQPGVWARLGIICLQVNRLREADDAFSAAVKLNSSDANSWHHLSITLHQQGRASDAERCSRLAVALHGSSPVFWLQLGNVLFAQEQFEDAAGAFRQSLNFNAFDPTAWNNLGASEHILNHLDAAQQAYESSLAIAPGQSETRLKLATLFEKQWNLHAAESLLQQVVAEEPQRADALAMLGRVRLLNGRQKAAIEALTQLVAIQPSSLSYSRLLHCMQYADDVTTDGLLQAHRAWDVAYAQHQPRVALAGRWPGDGSRPLRLGFVSADFGLNPIGYPALPLLEKLDKMSCSIACYFDCRAGDRLTARFRAAADLWRVTFGMPDQQVAEQIARDEIDILVDLMGHVGNRLLVFARRPAPMQITWLAYVGTTGISKMMSPSQWKVE